MTDQSFHEIQLSGKQLVFLFMSAVVLAVVIFLLGVSVGRGVRGSVASASAADVGAPTDTTASAAPAGTKVTPADLDYREKLQGQGGARRGRRCRRHGQARETGDDATAATPNRVTPTTNRSAHGDARRRPRRHADLDAQAHANQARDAASGRQARAGSRHAGREDQ